jgi:hypothetical protein
MFKGILNRSGVTTDYSTFVLRVQHQPAHETKAGEEVRAENSLRVEARFDNNPPHRMDAHERLSE